MRILVLVCLGLMAGCLWEGEELAPSGQDLRVTFLHTSDLHSRLFPFNLEPIVTDRNLGLVSGNAPFGGAARLGYLIKREKSRSSRVIHVDSGDCFQGAPVFNENFGEAEIRFLSMVGADAVVIGNHEFDSGVSNYINQLQNWATYDNLAANYLFPDPGDVDRHRLADFSQPFTIYNLAGVKVAVIGMANLGSLSSIGEGGNSLDITPLEQNETVRAYVNMLHESVDIVTVLTHLGLDEDEELLRGYETVVWKDRYPDLPDHWEFIEDLGDGRVEVFVPGVRNIDIIFGGHLHIVLNPPKEIEDRDGRIVPLVHSGAFAKYLGRFDVVLQDDAERGGKKVETFKYHVFPVDERLARFEDTEITEMLEPYLLQLNQTLDLSQIVGYAPKAVLRRSNTGKGDSALGNLVTESMRSRRNVEAEFSITNTLGIRDNFYRGPITLEDMFNVFPFENTLTVMVLTGREVLEVTNHITDRSASRGCQAQGQVAGMTFTMNCGQTLRNQENPEQYIDPSEDITINGRPMDLNASYKLVTNNFIANGGSGFRALKRNTTKIDTGISMRDALIDFLRQQTRCGDYERKVAKWCEQSDDLSQEICLDVGDKGRIPNAPNARGPYADTPCVVGIEDGRIGRVLGERLDTIDDPDEDGEGPE